MCCICVVILCSILVVIDFNYENSIEVWKLVCYRYILMNEVFLWGDNRLF